MSRVAALLVMMVSVGFAQVRKPQVEESGTPSTVALSDVTSQVLEEIKAVEVKLVKAAEDFPENLYNTYHLNGDKDVPTAADFFLETADFNATSAFQMSTKEQQRAMKRPDDKDYDFQSKADTVMKIKQSFAAVRKAVQDNPDPKNFQDWLFIISFSNQYYGTLRTYFYVNRLKPPQ